jgi:hypothetical protein
VSLTIYIVLYFILYWIGNWIYWTLTFVTTIASSSVAHTLQFTKGRTSSSQSYLHKTSADVSIPLGSRTVPMLQQQQFASYVRGLRLLLHVYVCHEQVEAVILQFLISSLVSGQFHALATLAPANICRYRGKEFSFCRESRSHHSTRSQ